MLIKMNNSYYDQHIYMPIVWISLCWSPNCYMLKILFSEVIFCIELIFKVWNECVLPLLNHLYTFSASMMMMTMKQDYRMILLAHHVAKIASFSICHSLQLLIKNQGMSIIDLIKINSVGIIQYRILC